MCERFCPYCKKLEYERFSKNRTLDVPVSVLHEECFDKVLEEKVEGEDWTW